MPAIRNRPVISLLVQPAMTEPAGELMITGISQLGKSLAAIAAILYGAISSFAAPALEDVIELHESTANTLSTTGSYLYSWRLSINDANGERVSKSKSLYRRKGNRFFQVNDFNGYTDPATSSEKRPDSMFFVVAFDGEITRSNNVDPRFLRYYQPDGPLLERVDEFDSYREKDAKAPAELEKRPKEVKYPPSGTIADGYGHTDPGMIAGDLFLEAVTYEIGLVINNKSTWAEVMRNGMAEVSSISNGVVRVTGHRLEPELRNDWPSRYELDIDIEKGGIVVGARIFNPDDTVWSELSVTEVRQDKSSGIWYPARYVEDINAKDGHRRYDVEMIDANFEPVPDEVFQNVWFDEQRILDLRSGRRFVYLRKDPSLYKESFYNNPGVLTDEDLLKRMSSLISKDLPLDPSETDENVAAATNAPPNVPILPTQSRPAKQSKTFIYSATIAMLVIAIGACAALFWQRSVAAGRNPNGGSND